MHTWTAKLTKYKRQTKVVIPKSLASLAGLDRCKYVFMDLDSSGKIIMEGFDERRNRTVKS